ncbi:M23 family metallopeptidase [Dongia sp.]|uniref:M23 family metallopeptidase n=1 Tax=Dongia sp. TaxID=1977262 RepID=UPI0035B3D5F5
MRSLIVLLFLLLTAIPAAAEPAFSLPAACELGRDCFVQNYVDADATEGARDFTCGSLTYDQHKGTDIRLRNYIDMERGVDVLAAAPGTVLRLRDGMDDVSVKEIGLDAVKDRMAGNSVIVDHGDGWVTQYAHMKKGSVAVMPGQKVAAGDVLGQIGLSGNTEFPHLHFEVRHNDEVVDPFTGGAMGAGCNGNPHALWQAGGSQNFAYLATGLLNSGFATVKPEPDAARHGVYAGVALENGSPALVYWVDIFGLQKGDRLILELAGPYGRLAESDDVIPRAKALYFAFTGIKQPAEGWDPGTYKASLHIEREGVIVAESAAEITLP